jgi:hypothetical protein
VILGSLCRIHDSIIVQISWCGDIAPDSNSGRCPVKILAASPHILRFSWSSSVVPGYVLSRPLRFPSRYFPSHYLVVISPSVVKFELVTPSWNVPQCILVYNTTVISVWMVYLMGIRGPIVNFHNEDPQCLLCSLYILLRSFVWIGTFRRPECNTLMASPFYEPHRSVMDDHTCFGTKHVFQIDTVTILWSICEFCRPRWTSG